MIREEGRDPIYVMGRSEEESRRLAQEGDLFKHSTRLLFEEAGIGPGMTILDLGCGSGDVALLTAELVGPTGRVVGVDKNSAALETARQRAEAAHAPQITFIAADIRDLELDLMFDAIVGRFVLMYLADPVATLRGVSHSLRSNAVAAFYEGNIPPGVASFPVSPLHQFVGHCMSEAFAGGRVALTMGWRLHQVLLDAGFTAPQLRSEALIGGEDKWMDVFASYAANTLRSLVPMILEYGIATEEEIDIDTFEQRYREEVLRERSVVQWWPVVGAWAHKT
jgi:SAM-dependent methyltransferase